MGQDVKFKPKIVGFVCYWWGYGAADLSGVSRLQYSPEIRLIRVMCSGRVDLEFIFKAFLNGIDGVFIVGCKLGECNYTTGGNYHALNMVMLAKKILKYLGLNENRLTIEFMSSADGIKFAEFARNFTKRIKEIGALGKSEGIETEELKNKFKKIIDLIPYIKVEEKEKLSKTFPSIEEYESLYSDEEVKDLLENVVSYYIDPEKCQACGICRRRCPVDAIIGEKKVIHVIDQDKCIKCGTCYQACPPKFKAVLRLKGEPVPEPLPEEERKIG